MNNLPGHIGRYEVLGLLGTGGMAEILLARIHGPMGFERPVVVKRILPHLAREQRFHDMFLDEARIVAGIRHQNVVHVHELGEDGGELYLVMEYLEGESASSLARRLAAHRKLLSFGLCAHLLAEVAAGLHAAHEMTSADGRPQGLVHRDVSPANVFLTYAGDVKIIDFGIAVAADRISRTEAGQVKGKYAYMSPEQCRGIPLDRRSDVFSMGTVLYEISTCRRLFKRASDLLTLQAVCHEAVVPPSHLVPDYPRDLESIVMRALAKNPAERYASASEMRRDLLEVARHLNGAKIPEESLSKVMRRLFPDRIEDKRRMLTRLRAGETLTQVPTADIDDGFELEAVEASAPVQISLFQSATGSDSAEAVPPPPAPRGPVGGGSWSSGGSVTVSLEDLGTGSAATSASHSSVSAEAARFRAPARRGALLAALVALFGLGAGLAVVTSGPSGEATRPERPREVELTVTTEPPGAAIRYDGRAHPRATPVSFRVAHREEPVTLEVRLRGYEPIEELVVPDRDQRLRLVMLPRGARDAARDEVGGPDPVR